MRLKQILRRLFQLPAFTAVAVITLAIGVGANAAVFSVVDGVLLRPLPYPEANRLVVLDHSAPGVNIKNAAAAPFLYFTYREDGRVFEDVAMWSASTSSVTGLAEPEDVQTVVVTNGLLPMLGAAPALGRIFTKQDDSPGSEGTVILTAGYWRSRFGGDPSAIGRRIMLDSRPREIIGVLPDSFRFMDRKPALILPMRLNRDQVRLGNFGNAAIAKLKPGVTLEQASADVARMIPIAIDRFPPFPGFNVKTFREAKLAPNLRSLKDDVIGDIGSVLWVLMGTIGLVLLIACANVANLLLVRAEGRHQELAIRSALGASRGRIAYELLIESLLLGILGGVVGLGLAWAAVRALIALAPANLPRLDNIAIDATVLAFTFAISVVAGLLFGAIPILKYARPSLSAGLRGGGRTMSGSRERHRARNTLVVVQVALALVLLVSAGLMIRTFQSLRNVHPGFTNPQEVLTFGLGIPSAQVSEAEAVVRMQQAIMDKIAAVPGVTSVGLASTVTMTGGGWHDPIWAADREYDVSKIPPIRSFKFVSPGLLQTMGNTLVAGRDFTWADVYDKRPVAMVSENLAREMWGQPSAAIGKQIRENPQHEWREIVGVVGDERDEGVDKKAPTIAWWPMQMTKFGGSDEVLVQRSMTYVVRSRRAGSQGFAEEVSRAVWSINPNLPVARVRTLEEIVSRSLARTSFTLVMLAIAGAMALLLGVAGIYGVIAYAVSQRTREIGIRMALGAQRQEVTRMFVRDGLGLTAIGMASGLGAAFVLMRLLRSLLFEVSPADPLTYVAVCAALTASAIFASYVPARRATSVNPVRALRAE
jgi:putative ABC transport system permease protein